MVEYDRNNIRIIASQAIENADSSQDRLRAAQVIALIDIADALEEQNRVANPKKETVSPVIGSSKTTSKKEPIIKAPTVEEKTEAPAVEVESVPKYTGINQAKAG